jgi:FKBP-type peptidyl-prolyl cis-trans isomerase SlpA
MKKPALTRAGCGFAQFSTMEEVHQHLSASRADAESFMSTVETSAESDHCVPSVSPPIVQPGSFLTLHYRMAGPQGMNIINTFDGKPATLSLGAGELSPALEARLLGLPEGTRATFELPAGEAFGERNPELLQWVARKLLNELGELEHPYTVGDVVQFPTPDGLGQYAGAVQQVKGSGDAVQFDFNHPLAGQPVVFEVQLIGVL